MILTAEIRDLVHGDLSNAEVEMFCDAGGLNRLIQCLQQLQSQTGPSHVHLATPAWAGNELTDLIQGSGHQLINQITISKNA